MSLGGGDDLEIDTVPIDGTQVLTPGANFDAGTVDFRDGNNGVGETAVTLDFRGLGEGGTVSFTDIGRLDNLIYRGTSEADTFSVDSAGQVVLNTQVPVNTTAIITSAPTSHSHARR